MLDTASAAIPTPLPITRTVPTVASAANPTAEAVTLDANHELAGKDLNCDIELVEVVD